MKEGWAGRGRSPLRGPPPGPRRRPAAILSGVSPRVDGRHLGGGGEALLEVDRGARVAGPEGVPAALVMPSGCCDLGGGVHGEAPGLLKSGLVCGAGEELEQRESAARG